MEWDSHATHATAGQFPAWGAPGDYRTVADLGPMTSRKSYATDLTVDQYLEGGAREVSVPATVPTLRVQGGAGDMGDPSLVGTAEAGRARPEGQPTHAPVGGSRAHAFSATSSRWDQARASGAASAPLTHAGASVSGGARDLWATGGVGMDAYAGGYYGDEHKPGYMMHTTRSLSQPFAPRTTQRGIPPPPMTAQPPRKMPLPAVRSGCARYNTTSALATRHGHPDFNNTFSHSAGPLGSKSRELAQFTLFEAPRYTHRAGYTGGRSHYKPFKPVVTPHASSSVEGSGGADPPSLTSRRRASASASGSSSSSSSTASAASGGTSLSRGITAVVEGTPTTLAAAHATQLRQHPVPRVYDMPVPSVDPLSPSPVVAVHNMNAVGKRKAQGDRKHRGTSRNVLGGFYTS